MTHLTPENLRVTIAAARERPTWKAIMSAVGAHEGTAYQWLRQSKKDCDARLQSESKFYVTFEGDGADYWHLHLIRAKAAFISGFERKVLDACANNLTETCFDPSTGRPLQALNPNYLHRSPEWFEANGLDYDFDRYEWERDAITDEIVRPLRPIWQTKTVQSSAQLKIRALAAMLPKSWSERTQTDHVVTGQVVHTVAPPRFVPRAVREQQQGEVTDAEFTEVRPALPDNSTRRDIVELRAMAERLRTDTSRVTQPDSPVRMADGTPVNNRAARVDDRPSSEDGNGPAAPRQTLAADRPTPKAERPGIPQPPFDQPRPSYARRASVEAARTSPSGGNLNRSIIK